MCGDFRHVIVMLKKDSYLCIKRLIIYMAKKFASGIIHGIITVLVCSNKPFCKMMKRNTLCLLCSLFGNKSSCMLICYAHSSSFSHNNCLSAK